MVQRLRCLHFSAILLRADMVSRYFHDVSIAGSELVCRCLELLGSIYVAGVYARG